MKTFAPVEDMARKKKDAEKSADVLALEARIRELELENLALNTLIDVAEKNGIDIRKRQHAVTVLRCYGVTLGKYTMQDVTW